MPANVSHVNIAALNYTKMNKYILYTYVITITKQ